MKQYKLNFSKECRAISSYRRLLVFLTLFTVFFAGNVQAQLCDQIAFNFEQYEPCRFRVTYDNSTECYTQLRLSLADGTFSNWNVIPNSGFIVEVISPSELWITHTGGFLPLGFQVPLLFTLPFDLNTSINIAYLNDCAQVGCDIFGGVPIESCPDPQNASIVGVKYKECGTLPYISQTPLSGWTIELLDANGNVIGEQVTDVGGSYVFYDLKAGSYVVREVQQPGWTPKVPASGQTAIDLMASQERIVNFGNCPPLPVPCNCPAGTQPGGNAVVNGNFSSGGGFNTSYTLNNTPSLQPGQYWIGSNPSTINAGFAACGDHTSGSGDMMVVNGGPNQNNTIWSQTFNVAPNTTYKFEAWVASLSSASPANVGVIFMIGNNLFGGVGVFAPVTTCSWERLCYEWPNNFNATTVTFLLINQNVAGTGNDFALDDISFRKCVPPHGDVTGVVYRECSSLPYTDQPVLSGWTVQLLDTMGNLISEQVTDVDGAYAFADLPPGNYYVKTVAQPGWTANVPANGQTTIELDAGESVVENFGVCLLPVITCLCPLGNASGSNLVMNPNFSSSGGFITDYTADTNGFITYGEYGVISLNSIAPFCLGDHTTGTGDALVASGVPSGPPFPVYWSQTVTVIPNTKYVFRVWYSSLTTFYAGTLFMDVNGAVLGQGDNPGNTGCSKWKSFCREWNSGNNTSATITLKGTSVLQTDLIAFDDFSFQKCSSFIGDISGTVSRTCDTLPNPDQPVLSGWTVQLLDTMGNLISEQVTNFDGAYAFYDLPPGNYICRTVVKPGWTPNFPLSGKLAIDLGPGEEVVANFGMCLDCTPCPPPTDLEAIDVGSTSATIKLATSSCSDRTCWWWDNEDGTPGGHFTYTDASITSIVIDDLVPGTTYNVWAFSLCDSIMSESSDTIRIAFPCFGGYTSCPGNLLSNGSFEGPFSTGLPNATDQIGLCPGWQQATNGSGVSSVGDWYTGYWQLPGSWPGYYNDVPNQQYTFFQASCGYRYAGFALNTCEGISTPLTASVAPGTGYNIGFWWSPKEPVTSNFTFLAILSNANCTVNTANGGTACTHQCAGDFHIPVTATPANLPGTWYFHSYTANAPASFTQLTFAAKSGGPIVNNYIFVDEVCVREVFGLCEASPKIAYNPDQPNAFLGEADLGAGSTIVSAVWEFGDGTKDSSCCLGSVIHDFAPGSYEVCLEVTAMDTSGTTCSNRTCIPVVITQSGGKCDHVAAFLQSSPLGTCCYDLNTNNIEPNCFTQIDVTLSSGSFVNAVFGAGWNIAINGNVASLTPTAGGFIPTGQDLPVTICDPGGTEPYTVDVDFVYAGGVCHRTFNYACYPDTSNNCCSDFNLFQILAAQVNTNEQYGDCSISVNGTALNDCMRIVWDWGDGVVEGPYTDNTPITHNYTGSGPHTVCYTVQEVDAAGQICWTWQKCLDLPVHCNDTCQCLGFTNLQFTSLVSPPPPPVPVSCENTIPVVLPCIANDAYYEFEGSFGCTNECTSSIGYQFFDANQNLLTYGQATYNTVLDQFSITAIKFPPGTYQLALTGYCGINDTCYCNVTFTIPDCPCCSADLNAFCQTVDNATNISLDPTNCKATLNIGNLPCQKIEWIDWNDGTVDYGPFLSGAMPMHFYAHSGTYAITYIAREYNPITGLICYNKPFTDTIQLNCNCSCGTYDMEIRLGGALNQPVVCGQTVNLGLSQGFAFYPKFQCQGSYCPPTAMVDWTLTGPGTNLSGTETTTPGVVFPILPLSPGQFTTPGTYTLTMTGHCDLNQCPCVITFNVQDPCCTDQAAFLVAAAAVQTFGTLGTCTLSFQAQGLNNCMRIRYDWGDNTSSGPFADNVLVTHTYSSTNTYNVCYTIEEVDFFGNVCWTYQSCEPVYVICNDCVCGSFSEMFARPTAGAQSIALACGGPSVAFGCPNPGFSIPITGKFECQGGNCTSSTQINWTLTGPGPNGPYSGTIQAGPYFYLPILPYQYGTPGNYTLTLVGNCGGQPCPPCVIKFSVNCTDPCPCDPAQLQIDVNKGFASILYNNSCKGCFSPIGLNDCDMVQWSVNGGPVLGMTNGNGTFCHSFSGVGSYSVTMTVIRKKGDGSFCAQASVTKTVTLTCFSWPDCGSPIIANPRMSIGAMPGGLNSGGESVGWIGLTGNPVVVEGAAGSLDAWTIDIGGKLDSSDVLSQLEPICLKKDTGMLSFRVTRPLNASHISFGCNLSVQLFRGSNFVLEYPTWNPIRCLKLASIELAPLDAGWVDVQVPYDITAWNVVDTCGDEPYGVYVRPVIYVNNALGSNQGGASTRSSVQIDNFCLDGTLVAVHNPVQKLALRIFPNPNPGIFTVQLPEAATLGMSFRIVGLTGQLLRTQSTQTGSAIQTVQAGDLPAGLYFLQVVEDGSVLAVEKFVKQ